MVRSGRRDRCRRSARAAYEDALAWAKTYTGGGARPIINHQYPGYVLGDVATAIEAARYFCWKGAHYLDQHDYHGIPSSPLGQSVGNGSTGVATVCLSMNAASPLAEGTPQQASPVVEAVGADDAPARATVSLVQLERDHALMVVRGAVSEVFLLTLRQHLGNLVAAGVRFVVLDLAEVTACPPEVVGELATACRALYAREGWLRSITTAPCVADALESADLDDLFPIYRAAGTEFRYAS